MPGVSSVSFQHAAPMGAGPQALSRRFARRVHREVGGPSPYGVPGWQWEASPAVPRAGLSKVVYCFNLNNWKNRVAVWLCCGKLGGVGLGERTLLTVKPEVVIDSI